MPQTSNMLRIRRLLLCDFDESTGRAIFSKHSVLGGQICMIA